jgi:hypothetical protein
VSATAQLAEALDYKPEGHLYRDSFTFAFHIKVAGYTEALVPHRTKQLTYTFAVLWDVLKWVTAYQKQNMIILNHFFIS